MQEDTQTASPHEAQLILKTDQIVFFKRFQFLARIGISTEQMMRDLPNLSENNMVRRAAVNIGQRVMDDWERDFRFADCDMPFTKVFPKIIWAVLDDALIIGNHALKDILQQTVDYLMLDARILRYPPRVRHYLTLFNGTSLLIPNGFPLLDTIKLLADQLTDIWDDIRAIREGIERGEAYSGLLAGHLDSIPDFAVNCLIAAESSGSAEAALAYLIDPLLLEVEVKYRDAFGRP